MEINKNSRFEQSLVSELPNTDESVFGNVKGCSKELSDFVDAINKVFPDMLFYFENSNVAYAYYKDEKYARGFISFGDIREWELRNTTDEKKTYNLWSPYIENKKSDRYNEKKYYCLSSVSMAKAVRNAAQYFREYTDPEIHVLNYDSFKNSRRNTLLHSSKELDVALAGLLNVQEYAVRNCGYEKLRNSPLMIDLISMYNAGHELGCRSELTNLLELEKEHNELANGQGALRYVRVREKLASGRHTFTIGKEDKLRCAATSLETNWSFEIVDTLPEALQGAVSVVNVLEDKQYVDGVGMKVMEGVFYVVE
tara:strand:- start:2537 stop:3469 length:933 start_codon:yes stop_codon:yes gene_type:complete